MIKTVIDKNTFEGPARALPCERQKREKRVSSLGFAKRVWKSDSSRLTEIATTVSTARFRLF